jgi:CheY-like chemotaxis protein
MTRLLSKQGFRVATASNGERGLALARELNPSVITLDVLMPGTDGWTVLTQLKADPALSDIPVVMLTMLDDAETGYALGATEFLTKPIDRDRLLTVLARYRTAGVEPTVLVVEDDAPTRELLRRLLEKEGWRVDQATNGREALAAVERSLPSLILLDLMMPEMDGFEFLEEMRRRGGGRRVPVIVVTAKTLDERDRQRLNGSVERVIQKGSHPIDELLAEIRSAVRTRPGAPR